MRMCRRTFLIYQTMRHSQLGYSVQMDLNLSFNAFLWTALSVDFPLKYSTCNLHGLYQRCSDYWDYSSFLFDISDLHFDLLIVLYLVYLRDHYYRIQDYQGILICHSVKPHHVLLSFANSIVYSGALWAVLPCTRQLWMFLLPRFCFC